MAGKSVLGTGFGSEVADKRMKSVRRGRRTQAVL